MIIQTTTSYEKNKKNARECAVDTAVLRTGIFNSVCISRSRVPQNVNWIVFAIPMVRHRESLHNFWFPRTTIEGNDERFVISLYKMDTNLCKQLEPSLRILVLLDGLVYSGSLMPHELPHSQVFHFPRTASGYLHVMLPLLVSLSQLEPLLRSSCWLNLQAGCSAIPVSQHLNFLLTHHDQMAATLG